MVHTTTKPFTVLGLSLACLVSTALPAAAQDDTTGRIIFSSRSIALGIGVSRGDGVLAYQGKTYVFTVSGLSVVDLGISRVTARGEVKNLRRIRADSARRALGYSAPTPVLPWAVLGPLQTTLVQPAGNEVR